MEDYQIGDKVIIKTNRVIKTLSPKVFYNDIVEITAYMAKGGYAVNDLLGKPVGHVRKSDIKRY